MQSLLTTFPRKSFSTIYGGHLEFLHKTQQLIYLEFLCKTQKRIYLGMVRDRVISTKFLTSRVYAESNGYFSAFFGGYLEFLRKIKKKRIHLGNSARSVTLVVH